MEEETFGSPSVTASPNEGTFSLLYYKTPKIAKNSHKK